MKESLRAVFDEAKAPTLCCAADIASQLLTVVQVALNVQKQIATDREKRVLASLEDPTYDGNVERLEQTDKAMEKKAADLIACARGLRDDMLQKARYAAEIEVDVTSHIAAVEAARLAREAVEGNPEDSEVGAP